MTAALALLMTAGCARPPLEAAALFRPPVTVSYTEHFSPGGMPAVLVEVTETTVATDRPGPPDWPGVVYETTNTYADGRTPSVTRYIVGERGVAYFATVTGEVERQFMPKLALPAVAHFGDHWEGRHADSSQPPALRDGNSRPPALRDGNSRRCTIEKTPFCKDGMATACTTTWDDAGDGGRATWMRQHWCPADGWVGFELVTASAGGTWATSFSTDVRRDGVSLPEVSMHERQVPTPEEVLTPVPTDG